MKIFSVKLFLILLFYFSYFDNLYSKSEDFSLDQENAFINLEPACVALGFLDQENILWVSVLEHMGIPFSDWKKFEPKIRELWCQFFMEVFQEFMEAPVMDNQKSEKLEKILNHPLFESSILLAFTAVLLGILSVWEQPHAGIDRLLYRLFFLSGLSVMGVGLLHLSIQGE